MLTQGVVSKTSIDNFSIPDDYKNITTVTGIGYYRTTSSGTYTSTIAFLSSDNKIYLNDISTGSNLSNFHSAAFEFVYIIN